MRYLTLSLTMLLAFAACGAHAQTQATTVTTTTTTQAPPNTAGGEPSAIPLIGAPATIANVVLATIKLGGIDMSSDAAIDDFAKIEYCGIYKNYRANEFDWRRVRVAMRKKIEMDKANYPDTLYLERTEKIGQYDFKAGMLLLQPESVLHTRALQLANTKNVHFCGETLTTFPEKFVALLDKPLILDGVDLTEDEARTVTAGLEVDPNSNTRLAYGRYTITLTSSDPPHATGPIDVNAKMDEVTLYQDAGYQRPFWSGQSSAKSYEQKTGGFLDAIPFKGVDPAQQGIIDNSKPVPSVAPAPAPTPGQ